MSPGAAMPAYALLGGGISLSAVSKSPAKKVDIPRTCCGERDPDGPAGSEQLRSASSSRAAARLVVALQRGDQPGRGQRR